MGEYDRHIFLYAKGHYLETHTIKDMRKIIGKRCGIEPKHISTANIISVLMKIVWNYINHETEFYGFIKDLHPENVWKHGHSEYNFSASVISQCLSVLRFQKVKDIPFKLGEPDSDILPKKPDETN